MASAEIIYPDPGDFFLGDSIWVGGSADPDIFLVSMTGMMGTDIYLHAPGSMGMGTSLDIDFAVDSFVGMGGYLSFLSNDVSVDDGLFANTADRGMLMNQDAMDGSWQFGYSGFAGFTFHDGTQDVYGYLLLTFTDTNTLEVSQVAYENDGSAIVTPSTPFTVPEPSTGLLLGLGLAGLSVAVRHFARSAPDPDSR